MKLNVKKLLLFALCVIMFGCVPQRSSELQNLVRLCDTQLEYSIQQINSVKTDSLIFPRTIENGTLKLVPASDWTSGFFPGSLWMMYELTNDTKWKEKALDFTLALTQEQWNANDHDIGFKMFSSFGKAIKYYNNPEYKEILIQSAKTLSTRYNPVVACIRSWNSNPKTAQWKYPVIIDNLMNLELLMWAAKETGNNNFKEIAVKHAQTTAKNHFRDDYSCYHVIDYDPETGEVLHKNTHQGAADNSDWARGQAWAVYGYTMMYRETGMEEFLVQAKNIANYLLQVNRLKDGQVPYWDFKAPNIPNEPYDASAAAVISSALFELYSFTNNKNYLETAQKLLSTLTSSKFLAREGENGGFLLMHSTGSKPYKSEVDVPLNYADYYFLESIIKNKKYADKIELTLNKN